MLSPPRARPMIGPARRYLDQRPSALAISVSVIFGLVFGALSGGFALAILITICALGVFGIWQQVAVQLIISDQLADAAERATHTDDPPPPPRTDHADITRTMRIPNAHH